MEEEEEEEEGRGNTSPLLFIPLPCHPPPSLEVVSVQWIPLCPWARTQLFVSRTGATSPLHFDQYANLYLQLAGHKRVSRTGCDIPDFKGSSRPFLSADYRTSDHLSERSRCFLLERARAEHSR